MLMFVLMFMIMMMIIIIIVIITPHAPGRQLRQAALRRLRGAARREEGVPPVALPEGGPARGAAPRLLRGEDPGDGRQGRHGAPRTQAAEVRGDAPEARGGGGCGRRRRPGREDRGPSGGTTCLTLLV